MIRQQKNEIIIKNVFKSQNVESLREIFNKLYEKYINFCEIRN